MHTNTLKDRTARALLVLLNDMANEPANRESIRKQIYALAKTYGVETAA